MAELYVYKVKYDAGAAPCVSRGSLSLAICKPRIRRSALPSDWIFGFGAKRLGERLIYIAEVTEKFTGGDYYRPRVGYPGRPDAVYRWSNGKLLVKPDARAHQDGKDAPKDVGAYPDYAAANVLISHNFRYFGVNGTDAWKRRYPALRDLIERLTQGERVHHSEAVHRELLALRRWIWSLHPNHRILGTPSDRRTHSCDRPTSTAETPRSRTARGSHRRQVCQLQA